MKLTKNIHMMDNSLRTQNTGLLIGGVPVSFSFENGITNQLILKIKRLSKLSNALPLPPSVCS